MRPSSLIINTGVFTSRTSWIPKSLSRQSISSTSSCAAIELEDDDSNHEQDKISFLSPEWDAATSRFDKISQILWILTENQRRLASSISSPPFFSSSSSLVLRIFSNLISSDANSSAYAHVSNVLSPFWQRIGGMMRKDHQILMSFFFGLWFGEVKLKKNN